MKSDNHGFLQELTKDNISGSSQLLDKINNRFLGHNFSEEDFLSNINLMKKKFRNFSNIQNYAESCEKILINFGKAALKRFLINFKIDHNDELEELISDAVKTLKKYKSFITISNSSTIAKVFLSLSGIKKIRVTVCESRPMMEGRILAKKLLNTGAEIKLITEAMIANGVEDSDAVVLGADKFFINGDVVNKVGSRMLAITASRFHKPVFVITDMLKLSKKHIFEPEIKSKKEIWDSAPSGIKIENYYFELIEKKFVTKLITNQKELWKT